MTRLRDLEGTPAYEKVKAEAPSVFRSLQDVDFLKWCIASGPPDADPPELVEAMVVLAGAIGLEITDADGA